MSEAKNRSQFDSESGAEAAEAAWKSKREQILKDHGLWEVWKDVPPADERDAPYQDFLPGGKRRDV